MNVYRSSPPLPSTFCPSYLVPSAHTEPLPGSKDSSEIEGFSSDDETTNAETGESAGDDACGSSEGYLFDCEEAKQLLANY